MLAGAVFGFVLKTLLITHGSFCYCWAGFVHHQGFSASHPSSEKGGGTQEVGRRQMTADPNSPQAFDTLWHLTLHIKLRGEEGRDGTVGGMVFW